LAIETNYSVLPGFSWQFLILISGLSCQYFGLVDRNDSLGVHLNQIMIITVEIVNHKNRASFNKYSKWS